MSDFFRCCMNGIAGCALVAGASVVLDVPKANAAERAIIVFDGSGSMWGQINGVNKIVSARQTLSRVLPEFPTGMDLGLIAYGHNRKGDCSDIQLLVPPGPVSQTAGQISRAVEGLNPKGKTPLSEAVRQAAEALRYTEDNATVILITDGLETCNADPCALGNELEQSGVGFTAHVIGFGLTEEEGRQVSCLADNTGGRYIPADDVVSLSDALTETVVFVPEPEPIAPTPERPRYNLIANVSIGSNGLPIDGSSGIKFDWNLQPKDPTVAAAGLPPIGRQTVARTYADAGEYTLNVAFGGGITGSLDIDLSEFETSEVTVPLDAGYIDAIAIPLNRNIGLDDTDFRWSIRNVETGVLSRGTTNRINELVATGDYEVIFHPGRLDAVTTAPERVRVESGETTQVESLAPVSRVVLKGNRAGRELTRREVVFKVFDQQNTFVTDSFGTMTTYLTAGTYRVLIEYRFDGKREQVEEAIEVGPVEDRVFEFTYVL
ncbi:MAG: VWA domain-containing protein [Pseudomonadota bacterium]